jgi:glutaredoxin
MSLVFYKYRFDLLKRTTLVVLFVFLLGCVKSQGKGSELIVIDDETSEPLATAQGESGSDGEPAESFSGVARIEIYAMSKCPFFAELITSISPIVHAMGDNLELAINYVGKVQGSQVICAHGPQEAGGNIVQLCAGKYGTSEQLVDFIECQSEVLSAIPDDWEECAQQVKLDVAKMSRCYNTGLGRDMLRVSASTAQKNGIDASPVVFLNGRPYEKARTELSIGRAICSEFVDQKPTACTSYAPATPVSATVVGDKRCTEPDCDQRIVDKFLNRSFDSVKIRTLDISESEGISLFKKSGFKYLPIVVFDAAIKQEQDAYWRLSKLLTEVDGGAFAYPIGRRWDPSMEICDDGRDNTNNGKIDCEDEHCGNQWICREEKNKELKLFVMSYCPYCTDALTSMKQVLKHFGNNKKNIDFKIEFYGQIIDDELYSMHGDTEVEEDLRQICAQKNYRENFKFLEYMLCRAEAFQKNRGDEDEDTWEECATDGIKASVIRECSKGAEGRKLLAQSFEFTERLGIKGTPSWLVNNKYPIQGNTPEQITDAFCRINKKVKGCK